MTEYKESIEEFNPKDVILTYDVYVKLLEKANAIPLIIKQVVEDKTHVIVYGNTDITKTSYAVVPIEEYRLRGEKYFTHLEK